MVDIAAILNVATKGLTFVEQAVADAPAVMSEVAPVVTALKNIFSKPADQITEEELDQVENMLDDELDDFETPLDRKE